jgi:uncharacterized delta-60 repeat protein
MSGLLAPPSASALLPGDLDPSFNGGQPVLLDAAVTVPRATALVGLVVDGEGRIVVTGSATDANGAVGLAIARLAADGSVDASFASGGSLVVQMGLGPTPFSLGDRIAPRSGGGWLVTGQATAADARSVALLAAFDAAGMPDIGFGSGGSVRRQFAGPTQSMFAAGSTQAPDGSSFFAGALNVDPMIGTHIQFLVAKVTAEGLPAIGFGTQPSQGVYVGDFSEAVTARSSGRHPLVTAAGLLVAGATLDSAGHGELLLVRLTAFGMLDPSFGGGAGFVRAQVADPTVTGASQGERVAIGKDAEIYVAGIASDSDGRDAIAVSRFTPGGVLDATFGTGGTRRIQTASGANASSSPTDIAVQPDGRILVIGTSSDDGGSQIVVLRLDANGNLDPTFGSGGLVRESLGTASFSGRALIDADARTVTVTGGAKIESVQHGLVTRRLLEPTTLPGGCAPSPSLGGAQCRLALLMSGVDASLSDGKLRRRLDRGITRGSHRLAAAEGIAGRALRRKLKKALAQLRHLRSQLDGKAAAHAIGAAERMVLLSDTDALVTEVSALVAAAS